MSDFVEALMMLLVSACIVAAFLIGQRSGLNEAERATWIASSCVEALQDALPVIAAADSMLYREVVEMWLEAQVEWQALTEP